MTIQSLKNMFQNCVLDCNLIYQELIEFLIVQLSLIHFEMKMHC